MLDQTTVPRINLPDVGEFRRRFERPRQPVVITGVVGRWKAMGRWSPDYFAEQLARSRIVKMLIKDYLADMASGSRKTYVPGMPLDPHLPMLIGDIDLPEYREQGSTASPRIWFGTRVIGPLHYDPTSNLHGIVYGGKRFTLFHPSQLPYLYPSSMFSTIPQMSQASINQPDYARFPRLRKAKAITVDLGPGDMLFLPAGWWHQVTTPTPTISIDFPWQKNDSAFSRPFLRLIPCKVLRKIRGRIGYQR